MESTVETAAAVAEQNTPVAPEQASTKKASKKSAKPADKKQAKPTSKKAAKAAAPKPPIKKESKAAAKKPAAKKQAKATDGQPREGSKKQTVIEMMRRKDGATMAEIASTTGWQRHSIRGFVAGTLKKMGITAESTKNANGERCYRIR